MTRSFEDAIAITRYLGLRHIWIDSLCILQDDPEDWDRELATMHAVYSNAVLTISVTGAEDGTLGCFAGRKLKKYVPIPYSDSKSGLDGQVYAFALPAALEARPDKYIEMSSEPLSARAWCFQERVLSRRVLHFATDQMYFECNAGFQSEDGLHLKKRYFTLHGDPRSGFLPVPGGSTSDTNMQLWYNILWSYGPRKLTKSSDKLPAFAGVAAVFAERLRDQYLAGIWRKSMIEGLLWQALDVAEVKDRKPSWSWVSIDGIPTSGLIGRWEQLAFIIDCQVDLVGESRFGEVKSGWIKMEAPLLPLILVESVRSSDDRETGLPLKQKHLFFRTPRGLRTPGQVDPRTPGGVDAKSTGRFDSIGQRHEEAETLAREGKVFALVLAVDVGDTSHKLMIYHSLLVTPVDEGGDGTTLKRLGFVNLEIESLGEDEVRTSRTTVTLE
ncbi:hypothetical protein AYO20_09034 [Fonsecaea nubica]|uniref:Heterokaryon incompatibility domain-containing protein n=1 Tax=Fonsecaea nubica TaxID=856822 RepID=A0A178CKW9_9EURO|nr:hypothetical protein AYO20_09034 [Fonsecaea nubica]OAL29742.1 hypothetical protein AYO20_09034 [Fonsecaea nubica]